MNNFKTKPERFPVMYEIVGIYIDWQIDNNLLEGIGTDPHGINSFEDFLKKNGFRIVEILLGNKKMLSIDLILPKFSLLKMLGIETLNIISDGLNGMEVEGKIAKMAAEMRLQCFDVLEYYSSRIPWNLTGMNVLNSRPDLTVIDLNSFNNGRIIVRVMTEDGYERITSANDILNGGVCEAECLVDATCYDEDIVDEMEKSWSEKLGIPVLGRNEEINCFYKYPK